MTHHYHDGSNSRSLPLRAAAASCAASSLRRCTSRRCCLPVRTPRSVGLRACWRAGSWDSAGGCCGFGRLVRQRPRPPLGAHPERPEGARQGLLTGDCNRRFKNSNWGWFNLLQRTDRSSTHREMREWRKISHEPTGHVRVEVMMRCADGDVSAELAW